MFSRTRDPRYDVSPDGTPSEGDRVERDGLGEFRVPADALYGIHTARAQENFDAYGERLSEQAEFLAEFARVKAAAARANVELGQLPPRVGEAIEMAAREIESGRFHDQFPLEIVQGGGGTSTNMNMNEVLANRANELLGASRGEYTPVHPLDHVNRSQSTNDVLPTALALAAHAVSGETLSSLGRAREALLEQAGANEGLEHLGRTCLRDAIPVPVSAVHRSQAHALSRAIGDLDSARARLLAIPLGATAVGTGLGAPDGYRTLVLRYLSTDTGLDLRPTADLCDGLASLEPFATVADAMAGAGRVLGRIAADLRLLSSGPHGGIGEVSLPALQAGSSMMPGKINPVLPEFVVQVSYQLQGAAHVVRLASAAGELEVNPMGPVVTAELLRGLRRLGGAATLFAERCITGLRWEETEVAANLTGSLQGRVQSAQAIGHERAAGASVTPTVADRPAEHQSPGAGSPGGARL